MEKVDLDAGARAYGKELKSLIEKWGFMYKYGGSDPFWSDGVNLNLLRNQALGVKRLIETSLPADKYPPEYYLDIPDPVPPGYMARSEIIRIAAAESLETYKRNPDLRYLKAIRDSLPGDIRMETSIDQVLRYETDLETAIRDQDLVRMRRHEYAVEQFRKELENEPDRQMSIFDFMEA